MKTRSQTRAEERNTSNLADELPKNRSQMSWDTLSIECMEFDPVKNKYVMSVKWPDGRMSQHDREDIYVKNPQEVIKFYEPYLKAPMRTPKAVENLGLWRLVLRKE